MKAAARLVAVLAAAFAAATVSAQPTQPPPIASVRSPSSPVPTPPYVNAETRALYAAHCGKDATAPNIPGVPEGARIGFAADPGQPARLIVCIEPFGAGLPLPITTIDSALAFMAYKPFAPYWPAAEARWGNDMGVLRDEVRRTPIADALAGYPYAELMSKRSAVAQATAGVALVAGDYDQAQTVLQAELDRLAALNVAMKGRADVGFEMSLLIGRLGNIAGKRDGPSAGADLIADLMARYQVAAEYRPNVDMNHAAMLAEAGRTAEALVIMRPMARGFGLDPNDPERYEISGSMREVGWIMACALTREIGPEAAAPYAALVTSSEARPVDPYLNWTKSTVDIRLRMHKCLDDPKGFVAAMQTNEPPTLSLAWLEFQEHGPRTLIGHKNLAGLAAEAAATGITSEYRQLPDSYAPALRAWLPPRSSE